MLQERHLDGVSSRFRVHRVELRAGFEACSKPDCRVTDVGTELDSDLRILFDNFCVDERALDIADLSQTQDTCRGEKIEKGSGNSMALSEPQLTDVHEQVVVPAEVVDHLQDGCSISSCGLLEHLLECDEHKWYDPPLERIRQPEVPPPRLVAVDHDAAHTHKYAAREGDVLDNGNVEEEAEI